MGLYFNNNTNKIGERMPNRKAKDRKQERKRKNLEIKRWKRQQKILKKEKEDDRKKG